jgi:hypothetical protein
VLRHAALFVMTIDVDCSRPGVCYFGLPIVVGAELIVCPNHNRLITSYAAHSAAISAQQQWLRF